jgi:hypothetical protein
MREIFNKIYFAFASRTKRVLRNLTTNDTAWRKENIRKRLKKRFYKTQRFFKKKRKRKIIRLHSFFQLISNALSIQLHSFPYSYKLLIFLSTKGFIIYQTLLFLFCALFAFFLLRICNSINFKAP